MVWLPAKAASLRAYAGAVAGNAQGSGSIFACTTSGPTIGNGWSAGLSLPTEGFAGCNLAGGITDLTGTSGQQLASQAATGPMVGNIGSSTLFAQARAGYWTLGGQASGTASGGTSNMTYHAAASFASFTDTLTLHSDGVSAGTAGAVNFRFLIDAVMQSLPHAPYTEQLDARLGIRVNNQFIWDAFRATLVNDGLPFVRGGATGLPGSFALGAGSLAGSALVTSTADFGFQWDVPFAVEVALAVNLQPCCYGASQSADLLNTAVLRGIDASAAGRLVQGFQVQTASGALLSADGLLAPVPEPATWGLWLLGLASLGSHLRCRARR
jgi:hypothetical protein